MKFGVITRVPPLPAQGESTKDHGNLATVFCLGLSPELAFHVMVNGRVPVFILGEVLLLDENGREMFGKGRKPSKWDVDCQEFDSIDQALACATGIRDREVE